MPDRTESNEVAQETIAIENVEIHESYIFTEKYRLVLQTGSINFPKGARINILNKGSLSINLKLDNGVEIFIEGVKNIETPLPLEKVNTRASRDKITSVITP